MASRRQIFRRLFTSGESRPVLRFACLALLLLSPLTSATREKALGQMVTDTLDVPQTQLTPIGTPAGPPVPSPGALNPGYSAQGYSAQGSYGSSFGVPSSPVPASGSAFDTYTGVPATGYYGAPAPVTSQGAFTPGLQPTGYGTPYYGGPANQAPPLIDAGGLACDPYAPPPVGGGVGPPIIPMNTYPPPSIGAPVAGVPNQYGAPLPLYPSATPSSMFPEGLWDSNAAYSQQLDPYALMQRGRFRYGYIWDGSAPDDLSINEMDVALTFACGKLCSSTQPLYVSPSFSMQLWDGPNSSTGADLPGEGYGAFLDFSWQSDPNRIVGAELGFNFGVFSATDAYRSESIRYRGRGLGTFRVTPVSTFKLGVVYLDRVDIKLLPAIGVFCRPNPFSRWDIFFPTPKYARYCSTVGTQDLWWYIAGEYGGGSWTINRADGRPDQVDLNDIRLLSGFEWGPSERMRLGLRTWHAELGWVTNRQIVYRHNPQDNLDLGSTFMVRVGVGY